MRGEGLHLRENAPRLNMSRCFRFPSTSFQRKQRIAIASTASRWPRTARKASSLHCTCTVKKGKKINSAWLSSKCRHFSCNEVAEIPVKQDPPFENTKLRISSKRILTIRTGHPWMLFHTKLSCKHAKNCLPPFWTEACKFQQVPF